MGKPKITHNEDYNDDGGHVIRITAEIDHDELDKLREIIDKSKCVYVVEPNPYNARGNGQPMKHTDNRTGAVHLVYHDKKVSDAIVVGTFASRTYLQLVLENGDQEPYACESKEELEWFRENLGFSTIDRNLIKI